MGGFSTIPRMYLPSDALPPDMQDGSQMTGVDAPLPRIMTPSQPVSGHMAHVLSTADSMGGPIAPDPATIAAAMPPQPKVVQDQDPLHQREGHLTNQLQADYRKDANPWGSANNHPGIGGKIAHVLSRVGNIAGDIVAPGQMAMIPGTEQYRRNEEEGLARELSEVQGEESKNAYQDAQTAHTNAETPQVAPNAESERGLRKVQTETGQQAIDQGPSLIQGHAHAVNQAIKAGRDPATDPLVMQYEDAIQRIQKQPVAKDDETKTSDIVGPDGKEHTMGWDPKTKRYDVDMGLKGEKPPTVNVNAGLSALDRETARMAKPYEKGVSDANAQLEKIADARTMVNGSAEAQALGVPKVLTALVSGQGSGVRITQPELNAIAKARGLAGDVEGTLRSWSGEGKLTPTQQKQLTGILDDVQQRILAKQAIYNDTLDRINGAASREDVIRADKEARQKLADLEKHAQGENAPQRPANVPEGYIFKDGPKGKGWYRP